MNFFRAFWLIAVSFFVLSCASRQFSKVRSLPIDVQMRQNGVVIGGQFKLLRGGSVQWFRMPESVWEDRLKKFKAAGFNTVDMYVPWAQMEPEEGKFDFETYNIRKFLDLTKKLNLYVYFRPAGYFTNEYDGGGVPYWILKKSTKQSTAKDGLVNLRTQDPDWIELLTKYYKQLNAVIRPYLANEGGNIIAYAIENELNGFLPFAEIEKIFFKNGKPERDLRFILEPKNYLGALVEFLKNDGIGVPITTCPALGAISVTGNHPDVIPWTNIYLQDGVEALGYKLKAEMMDPKKFGGVYSNFPSGVTETDPAPSKMKSLLASGMDAFFAFNVVGMAQTGFRNTVVPNPAKDSIFEFNKEKMTQAFISPTIGYFHNVLDYWSAVTPSGMMRDKFFDFRSANMFLNDFESAFAEINLPEQVKLPKNSLIGASDAENKIIYKLLTKNSGVFLGVANEMGSTQTIPKGLFDIQGSKYPKNAGNTIPSGFFPGAREDAQSFILKSNKTPLELRYFAFLPQQVPLTENIQLKFSTSEILTRRKFNGNNLLVLYGAPSTQGEVTFSGKNLIVSKDFTSVSLEGAPAKDEYTMTYNYPESGLQPISFKISSLNSGKNETIQVVILSRQAAGRTWFAKMNQADSMLVGADFLEQLDSTKLQVSMQEKSSLFVFSSAVAKLNTKFLRLTKQYEEGWTMFATQTNSYVSEVLSFQGAQQQSAHETLDKLPVFASDIRNFDKELAPLETFRNPSVGAHWYSASSTLTSEDIRKNGDHIYIEHASDFVSLYVNGKYFTTLSPMGTSIDTKGFISSYKSDGLSDLLVVGKNTLVAKVHIWGRGSFMFPSGGFAISTSGDGLLSKRGGGLPAIGFDSSKGLYGNASLAGRPLENWNYGSGNGFQNLKNSPESSISFPQNLENGKGIWVSKEFKKSELTNLDVLVVPKVISLSGKNAYATIYLNNTVIGRWTSDSVWLSRGSWARATREMWSKYNPNEFPILPEELLDTNTIRILFESAAAPGEPAVVDSIRIQANGEDRALEFGVTSFAPLSILQFQATF
jgi:hypothetical protein